MYVDRHLTRCPINVLPLLQRAQAIRVLTGELQPPSVSIMSFDSDQ